MQVFEVLKGPPLTQTHCNFQTRRIFCSRQLFVSLHRRSTSTRLRGGWWCAVTVRWREMEFSAYWATTTEKNGTRVGRWKAFLSTRRRCRRTSTPTRARYTCCWCFSPRAQEGKRYCCADEALLQQKVEKKRKMFSTLTGMFSSHMHVSGLLCCHHDSKTVLSLSDALTLYPQTYFQ